MPLLRYPGSKEKLVGRLWRLFPDSVSHNLFAAARCWEYREPFFGSGAIGFPILNHLDSQCSVWLNDADEDIVCLWRAVKNDPEELSRLVAGFTPTVEAFFEFKQFDGSGKGSDAERGFRKLALHRMSMSGFGVMSGGPIGGKKQSGKYTVGCRWNATTLAREVSRLHRKLNKFRRMKITCGDFAPLVRGAGEQCFIYLDPPYYAKGKGLYRCSMEDECHSRLAKLLRKCSASWVLSYDDHSRIRELYDWAEFHDIDVCYTNAVCLTAERKRTREIAITPAKEIV